MIYYLRRNDIASAVDVALGQGSAYKCQYISQSVSQVHRIYKHIL